MSWGESPAGATPLWSLAIEEQFYLLWPTVVWLLRPRALARLCVALICAALVVRSVSVHAGLVSWAYNSTPSRLDALALGALVALVVRDPLWLARVRARLGVGTAAVAGALLVVMIPIRGLPRMSPWTLTIGTSLTQLLFAAFVLACVLPGEAGWRRLVSLRPLRMMGRYSYGMYIFHLPLHLVLFPHFEPWLSRQAPALALAAGAAYFTATVLLVLGVAALSYETFEKQFLALKEVLAPRLAGADRPQASPPALAGQPR
jgi:peptidoglycan/LPS O-acetylase OafA/YrhL